MNGVTGRMGTNQHLVRSIVAIRNQGGVLARPGAADHAGPDPGRPQRGQGRGARAGARHRAPDDRSRRRARQQGRRDLLRQRVDRPAAGADPEGDRRGQAHLHRKAGRADARRGARSLSTRGGGGRETRRRAGQALAAGPAEAEDADRFGLLRPHPLGARRVRLLGLRGRLAARAAAVVELPQGGRRRHHRRHAVPLALRPRQPVRRGAERAVPRRHAHPAAVGRGRQAVRGHRRGRRLRDLRARRRRHRPDQQLVVHARAPRRPRHVPRRRHARLGRGRTDRLPHPAAHRDAAAGVESGRAASHRLPRRPGSSSRRTARTTTRSRSNGSCSCGTSSTAVPSSGICWKARRACSSPSSAGRAGGSGASSTSRRSSA